MSDVCHVIRKRACVANVGLKNNRLFTIVAVIFRRSFDENDFTLTLLICARSGSMRLFV